MSDKIERFISFRPVSESMTHLRPINEMNETTTTEIWTAVDQAQLKQYEAEGPKEIMLGDIEYRINKYFMDDNSVPTLGIVAKKSRIVSTIRLSQVWSEYQNYSALDNNGREELRRKYFL